MIDDRTSPDDDDADAILHKLDTLHDRSHVRQYRESEWRILLSAAGFDLVGVERYHSSRPMTAFTKDVAPSDVREIDEIVSGLSARQRDVLGARDVDGQRYMDHFYITLVADRR